MSEHASMQRAVVIGAGTTGVAVAALLVQEGWQVTLSDVRSSADLADTRSRLTTRLGATAAQLSWETGGHGEDTLCAASLIVLSPGVPSFPALEAARQRGIEITGEIELAARRVQAPLVGITGTNGKSTVTALCGRIAEATGRAAFTGGNLGTPLAEAIGMAATGLDGLCVVELSSYQLETFERTRPRAAALLNLTPDHLDRYGSMEAYGAAKLNIARSMGTGDVLVVNGDDPVLGAALDRWIDARFGRCRDGVTRGPDLYRFVSAPEDKGRVAFCDQHDFVLRLDGGEERYPRSLSRLMGRHNDRNVLSALLLMRASGLASPAAVRKGLAGFTALAHRMELVAERGGVRYYDDSKATNVDSVVAGLDGFPLPFALIAGGRDKGGSYAPLVAALRGATCRGVVTIGEAAPLIEQALVGSGLRNERAASLPEAVARARAWVTAGEAVVLSPACSSFDMFRDYAHRGGVFKEAAEAQA